MSFYKKHQKKILVVFSVGLMIAFTAELGTGGAGGTRIDPVVGKLNSGPVHASELEQASREWRALQRYLGPIVYEVLAVPSPDAQMGGPGFRQSLQQARMIENEISDNSDLFFLLAREARDAGVRPDPNLMREVMAQVAPTLARDDEPAYELLRAGITDLLLIRANFDLMAANVKVSDPLTKRILATQVQTIKLNIVPIPSSDFSSKVPAPTTQQVQAQFDKFASVPPGQPVADSNPFGFGYQLPQRVKLQYFEISRDAALKVVQARKSPYDWDVAAHLYYYEHPDEFATTQPSSQPATTKPVASATTTPAVRPFAEVRTDALHHVQDPLVDRLVADVQNKITSTLQTDWQSYDRAAAKASSSTTKPASSTTAGEPFSTANSLGENYPSYTYLRKLADAVQAEFHLKVDVNEQARDFLSAKDLAALPGIGESSDNPSSASGREFAEIAMQQASAYLKQTDKDSPAAKANLLKPSVPLEDYSRNVFIFRLLDARPAEPPASAKDVASQIDTDLRAAAAYQLAKDAAEQVLSAAKTGSLNAAAKAGGRSVITTEPLAGSAPLIAPGLSLTPQATQSFIKQAQNLLAQYNPKTDAHPMTLIELPADGQTFVARLSDVSATWSEESRFASTLFFTARVRSELLLALQDNWYANPVVVQRVGYVPAQKDTD